MASERNSIWAVQYKDEFWYIYSLHATKDKAQAFMEQQHMYRLFPSDFRVRKIYFDHEIDVE